VTRLYASFDAVIAIVAIVAIIPPRARGGRAAAGDIVTAR